MINKELLVAAAKEIGVELDDMAVDRFELFEQRLMRWNNHINLTAITDPDEIVIKHFVDSLTVIANAEIPSGARVVDVGCGAGFPSLPMLVGRPDLEVSFVDSVGKKLGFIKEFLRYSGLMGETIHERAEIIGRSSEYRECFDVAVTRAVAPLNILCEYCLPLLKDGGLYVSMKANEEEVDSAREAILKLGGMLERTISFKLPNGDARCLIFIRKISQTPSKYPRKSKKISSRPL